jgi:hypothetical protein
MGTTCEVMNGAPDALPCCGPVESLEILSKETVLFSSSRITLSSSCSQSGLCFSSRLSISSTSPVKSSE